MSVELILHLDVRHILTLDFVCILVTDNDLRVTIVNTFMKNSKDSNIKIRNFY